MNNLSPEKQKRPPQWPDFESVANRFLSEMPLSGNFSTFASVKTALIQRLDFAFVQGLQEQKERDKSNGEFIDLQLLSALESLVAVARRYLPDYDEHPESQRADDAIKAAKGE